MLDNYLNWITSNDTYQVNNQTIQSGRYDQYEIIDGEELVVYAMTNIPYKHLIKPSLAIFKRSFKHTHMTTYYFVATDYENNDLIVYDQDGVLRNSSVFVSLHAEQDVVAEYLDEALSRVSNPALFRRSYFNGPF